MKKNSKTYTRLDTAAKDSAGFSYAYMKRVVRLLREKLIGLNAGHYIRGFNGNNYVVKIKALKHRNFLESRFN